MKRERQKLRVPANMRRKLLREIGIGGGLRPHKSAIDMTGQQVVRAFGLDPKAVRLLPCFVLPVFRRNGFSVHAYYRRDQFPQDVVDKLGWATSLLVAQGAEEPLLVPLRGYIGSLGDYRLAKTATVRAGSWIIEIDGVRVPSKGMRFRLVLESGEVFDAHPLQRGWE